MAKRRYMLSTTWLRAAFTESATAQGLASRGPVRVRVQERTDPRERSGDRRCLAGLVGTRGLGLRGPLDDQSG
ncbi:MAG TPA: hypothetical protein VM097_01250, partial [Mycobacteriales bacterium]|nr:hypothetical protein [Mycobacteriales bacterium]